MAVIVRPIRKDEIDQLITLCHEHAEYENSHYTDTNKDKLLKKELFRENPVLKCFVAEDNGLIAGYTTFIVQFSTWDAAHYVYMDCLYLKEVFRGKGIGKQLLNVVTDFANRNGYSHVQWQTPADNAKAINFYKMIGAESKAKQRFFLPLS